MKLLFRTHAHIRLIWAISLVISTICTASAQCPAGSIVNGSGTITNGQTTCITTGVNSNIQLNNGATMVVISGGNYTGNLSSSQGSAIQIETGGTFAPSQANNFAAVLTNNGTAVINNVSLSNGAAITNSGNFTWASNWNQNNAITVSNTACGSMTFSTPTNVGSNAVINNNGVLNFAQNLNTSSGSTINNRGRVTVNGNFNSSGLFYNQHIAVFAGNSNINSGDSIVNLGEMTFSGSLTSAPGIRNEGLFTVGGSYTINSNSIRINNSNAQLRVGGSLNNNGQIRGNGSLHVAGSVSNNQTIAGYDALNRLTVNKVMPGSTSNLLLNPALAAADTSTYTPTMANPDACTALPVRISTLQAAYYNGQVQLNWFAYAPTDARFFTIEYSQDGRLFTRAGELTADSYRDGQNVQTSPYVFIHAPVVTGTVFYRIRVTTLGGNMYYSNMVVVKTGNTLLNSITVFPNPFTDILQISMQLEKAGMIQVALYNANGQLVRKQQHTGVLGRNTITISDLSALPTGSYLVQIKSGNHTSFGKLIK